MKLKKVIALTMASIMTLSLTACGGNAGNTATTGTTASPKADATTAATTAKGAEADTSSDNGYPDYSGETLSLMWWGSDTRHEKTIKVIEMYEELTGIDITYEYLDGSSYWTSFQAKMAANDLPDVFQMGNNWLVYYDTIYPLNDYIADGTIDTTNISDAMLATTINQANGDVTGISNGTNARCFAYNPAIFDEAGVPYPTDNWTWDDFADACRKITAKTGNPAITSLEYETVTFSTVTQWKEGYNFYAKDGSDFAFNGDTEPITYIMTLMNDLMNEGCIGDWGIQNEVNGNIEADWIAYGDAAIVMLSSNQFNALSNVAAESGIELELATFPRVHADGQSGMVVRSSQQMSIYSGSDKKDIAANFLNFWVNDVEANKILNCERGVSISSDVLSALQSDSSLTDTATAKIYAFIDKVGSFPDIANSSPAEPAASEEIKNVLKQTYYQGLSSGSFSSVQEAADKFWAEAQEIWKQY